MPLKISGDADRYNHRDGNDDYRQPRALFELFDAGQRQRLFGNYAAAMAGVPQEIIERALGQLATMHPDHAAGVRAALAAAAKTIRRPSDISGLDRTDGTERPGLLPGLSLIPPRFRGGWPSGARSGGGCTHAAKKAPPRPSPKTGREKNVTPAQSPARGRRSRPSLLRRRLPASHPPPAPYRDWRRFRVPSVPTAATADGS